MNEATPVVRYRVDVTATVVIDVTDPEQISRGMTPEWADALYGYLDTGAVLEHLAFNAVVNGVWDASHLDGWGDLEPGALRMDIDRDSFSVDGWHEVGVTR